MKAGNAIDELPNRNKLVMSLYYQEELNLKEIGGTRGKQISQILSQNVKKLRGILFEEETD